MAKVSKVNVAITGDSKGLQKAGDEASATMRKIRAQADATGKQLGGFRGQADLLASSLGKLGVRTPALGALGGAIGLGQGGLGAVSGLLGSKVGLAFAGLAAGALVVDELNQNYQNLTNSAKAAADAMASGVTTERQWRARGFTAASGRALAAYGREVMPPVGYESAKVGVQALEARGGPGFVQRQFEEVPAMIGALIGSLYSGGASAENIRAAAGVQQDSLSVIPGINAWTFISDQIASLRKWASS